MNYKEATGEGIRDVCDGQGMGLERERGRGRGSEVSAEEAGRGAERKGEVSLVPQSNITLHGDTPPH